MVVCKVTTRTTFALLRLVVHQDLLPESTLVTLHGMVVCEVATRTTLALLRLVVDQDGIGDSKT